ncbi:TerB family tellurite resistance protein [Ningiella sp. W23]|uniref:TerB family tellurite resistance protein n=1 Tax=Ningiella sp. W23 TaxID=3023715 RepID=UPI003757726B
MSETIERLDVGTQKFNEALIKMAVLLYQIDGKITLTEQDYFDALTESLEWRSGIVLPAFINQAIHQAREAISQDRAREFLRELGGQLNLNPAKAFEVAMDITAVDGKRSDEELELLSLLSNRVLAKGLVA